MPNQNTLMFQDNDNVRSIVEEERNKKTTLTEWFKSNELLKTNKDLLYTDFPSKMVWKKTQRKWTVRKKGQTIGRMYHISPSAGEQYYLRMLLTKCRGSKSFEDLKLYNGIVFESFKAACIARGLLETDEEWSQCLQEASLHQTGVQLRNLFATILLYCEPISPFDLWQKFSNELSEDILYLLENNNIGNQEERKSFVQNEALKSIDKYLQLQGRKLEDYAGIKSSFKIKR